MKCFLRRIGRRSYSSFTIGAAQYTQALGTEDLREAEVCLGPIREALYRLERGLLAIPSGVDVKAFIVAGGQVLEPPTTSPPPLCLGELAVVYLAEAVASGGKFLADRTDPPHPPAAARGRRPGATSGGRGGCPALCHRPRGRVLPRAANPGPDRSQGSRHTRTARL